MTTTFRLVSDCCDGGLVDALTWCLASTSAHGRYTPRPCGLGLTADPLGLTTAARSPKASDFFGPTAGPIGLVTGVRGPKVEILPGVSQALQRLFRNVLFFPGGGGKKIHPPSGHLSPCHQASIYAPLGSFDLIGPSWPRFGRWGGCCYCWR